MLVKRRYGHIEKDFWDKVTNKELWFLLRKLPSLITDSEAHEYYSFLHSVKNGIAKI